MSVILALLGLSSIIASIAYIQKNVTNGLLRFAASAMVLVGFSWAPVTLEDSSGALMVLRGHRHVHYMVCNRLLCIKRDLFQKTQIQRSYKWP